MENRDKDEPVLVPLLTFMGMIIALISAARFIGSIVDQLAVG